HDDSFALDWIKVCRGLWMRSLSRMPSLPLEMSPKVKYIQQATFATSEHSTFLQAFLGRPLRISFAIDKVRGGPVVVPRLPAVGESNN
ncbi:hypothetical protein GW17_00028717, partial [Ensete ventricosum]